MGLPKISTPTYELELPSTGQTIKYRPFLVKEEKLLVLALESEDTKQITTAIKTVIKNCIFTKNIKVEALPTFDIEYLFLNVRGKSVGEEIEVNVICPDDEETNTLVKIDLESIKVQKNEDHTNKIKIDSTIACHRSVMANENEKIITHISNFRKVKRIPDVIDIFYKIQQKY